MPIHAVMSQFDQALEHPSKEFELTANSLGAQIETHSRKAHFEDTQLPHNELTR